MQRLIIPTLLIALFATGATAQSREQANLALKQVRDEYLQASCRIFVVARTDPNLIDGAALTYFDALLQGASMGSVNAGQVVSEFEKACDADPALDVRGAMQSAARALEQRRQQE